LKEIMMERNEVYISRPWEMERCVNPQHLPVEEVWRNEVKPLHEAWW
jgi:hypothetical protein